MHEVSLGTLHLETSYSINMKKKGYLPMQLDDGRRAVCSPGSSVDTGMNRS